MSADFDRVLALEDEARILRRDLEEEQNERRVLAERVQLAEERLAQAESDVKDAHDRLEVLEDWLERFEPEKHEEPEADEEHEGDEVDERELGEAGA